jgi:hypothetical protein
LNLAEREPTNPHAQEVEDSCAVRIGRRWHMARVLGTPSGLWAAQLMELRGISRNLLYSEGQVKAGRFGVLPQVRPRTMLNESGRPTVQARDSQDAKAERARVKEAVA